MKAGTGFASALGIPQGVEMDDKGSASKLGGLTAPQWLVTAGTGPSCAFSILETYGKAGRGGQLAVR